MKKIQFFYPRHFSNHDYSEMLDIARNHCRYFLLSRRMTDCNDYLLIKDFEENLLEKKEKLTTYGYLDTTYLFKMNDRAIEIIKEYSSNIYDWSVEGSLEDICFLREDKSYFFQTVAHENYINYFLTKTEIVFLSSIYHSRLCPIEYLDVFPLFSDNHTRKLYSTIRHQSLADYLKLITDSYSLALKITRGNIKQHKVFQVPVFPLIQKLPLAIEFFTRINADDFGDQFGYFSHDIDKAEIINLISQLNEIKSELQKYMEAHKEQSVEYFKNCFSLFNKEYARIKELAHLSNPWDQPLWDERAKEILNLSKLTEELIADCGASKDNGFMKDE